MSSDLISFLRARFDEDEQDTLLARGLADVEAKRRLMTEILDYEAIVDGEFGCCHSADDIAAGLCLDTPPDRILALRLLALPYADHPDYREEWKA